MRVLVCGGRDYENRLKLFYELDSLNVTQSIDCIIHGGARGADYLAKLWGRERQITVLEFPANWERDGKAAGPIRNQQMLVTGNPDLVMAFPGGRGTADMVNRARKANVEVREIT